MDSAAVNQLHEWIGGDRMVVIINADCLEAMKQMDDNSVHSIVTDPPYGLSFMGKKWDYDVPSREIWVEALRVLKPGGFLLSFAGSRTYHRMAVAIEDAGFEIRDQIMWIYGSGFPKSHNISKGIDKKLGAEREMIRKPFSPQQMMMKDGQNERPWQNKAKEVGFHETASNEPATPEAKQWQGWGTALKPAHEPIVVARKPVEGTVADNILEHGVGGINIDGSRVGDLVQDTSKNGRDNAVHKTTVFESGLQKEFDGEITTGRFPANIIHDGSEEVKELFPNTKGGVQEELGAGGFIFTEGERSNKPMAPGYDDEGSAARYFKEAQFSEEELQPSHNPIVVARKPIEGTVAENILEHGTGGLNIDESRVEHDDPDIERKKMDSPLGMFTNPNREGERGAGPAPEGRFPANVILDKEAGAILDEQVGELKPATSRTDTTSTGMFAGGDAGTVYADEGGASRFFKESNFSEQEHEPTLPEGRFPANVIHDGSEEVLEGFPETKSGEPGIMRKGVNEGSALGIESRSPGTPMTGFGDSGSAARFFYCAKASTSERNAGIEEAKGSTGGKGGGIRRVCEFCGTNALEPEACKCEVKSWINPLKKNFHPTVKPIALMEYLCRLVTPPGGTILDPFMGSGSTGIAALRLKFEFIGIEMSEEYVEIAATRIAHWVDAELTFEDGEVVLKDKPQAEWL